MWSESFSSPTHFNPTVEKKPLEGPETIASEHNTPLVFLLTTTKTVDYFLRYTKERWLNALDMLDATELWTIQSDRELRYNANTGQEVLWSNSPQVLFLSFIRGQHSCSASMYLYTHLHECVRLSCDFTESPGHVRPRAGLLRAGNRSETKFALSRGSLNAKMCKKINRGLCLWVCVYVHHWAFFWCAMAFRKEDYTA